MTWRDALFGRRTMGVRLGLDAIRRVDRELGCPVANARFVAHIVGTNGKGSTAAMVAHGLARGGLRRVGLFTSPHLVAVGERMRVDGAAAPDAAVEQLVERVMAAERRVGEQLSFFEVITLAALLWFADHGVESLVLEAGLGGRLDSTRIRRSTVSLVTRIGLDHQAFLGERLEDIAAEKAAVLHAGAPAYSVGQRAEVELVLHRAAQVAGCELRFVEPTPVAPRGLVGDFQRSNAALAFAAVRAALPGACWSWLDGVRCPGRWDRRTIRRADVVFDVAHNDDAIEGLIPLVRQFDPSLIVFGCMSDKPAVAMAQALRRFARTHWLVGLGERGVSALPGWEFVGELGSARARTRWQQACADPIRVLVCGSHLLVGSLLAGERAPDPGDPRHRATGRERRPSRTRRGTDSSRGRARRGR
ncbi:MAG: hypothetical protein B7733_01145 [Myxococcales bacterium FL481]|nr:MAG: hypothetical protein B7733_01145 [Myxococcales bacterium FL481]